MGDNSVDMIPPSLDNGEPNSTMANQIVYSPKEIILRGILALKWHRHNAKLKLMVFDYIVFIELVLYVHCQQQMSCRKGKLYRFKPVLLLLRINESL